MGKVSILGEEQEQKHGGKKRWCVGVCVCVCVCVSE